MNTYCDDCENEDKCTECHAYFLNETSFKCVVKCAIGEFGNTINFVCEKCDSSCKYCTEKEDNTKCTECLDPTKFINYITSETGTCVDSLNCEGV